MIRRSFLSALAAWFPGSTLLARYAHAGDEPVGVISEPTTYVDAPKATEPHPCPICANRQFNYDRWLRRLEELISKRLPNVTFGEVELLRGETTARSITYEELSPTHAVVAPFAANGIVFAQDIGTAGKVDDLAATQADLSLIDERLSLVVPLIVDQIKEASSKWGGRLYHPAFSAYSGPIVCQVKEIEAIRLQMTFATAIRGIIAVAPATPPAKL